MREILKQMLNAGNPDHADFDTEWEIEIQEALTCEKCGCLRITHEEARQLDEAWGRSNHPCYTEVCECPRDNPPPKCQRCESDRILEVCDTTRGNSDRIFHHLRVSRRECYAHPLQIDGLNDMDGVMGLKICMQCGQVQGQFPTPDPNLAKDMDPEVLVQAVRSYEAIDF